MPNAIPHIERTGVIFRAGDYGAKGTYSDADIDGMATETPVPVKMSHHPTLLEGKLGEVTRTFAGFDELGRKVLFGVWNEPQPLAQLLGEAPRPLSAEITLKDKKLAAVALEINPAIKDAAFFSDAVEGAYAKFSAGEEIIPLSAIPAQENIMPENAAATPQTVAPQTVAPQTVAPQTVAPPAVNPQTVETPEKPGFMESLRALFSAARPDELDAAEHVLTTAKTGKTPRELELENQLAQFNADKEKERLAAFSRSAESLADALVEGKRIAAKGNEDYERAVAAFTIAARYDAEKKELAYFAEDSPVAAFSLTDHLKAMYAATPQHDLNKETVSNLNPEHIALFEQKQTTVTDPATGDLAEYSAQAAATIIAARNGQPAPPSASA